jgi:putative hydrolase of the HAD superfamily
MQKQPLEIFDSIETWVFDLDNTLYPASSGLFNQVSQRMTAYISEYFSIAREEALERQRSLFMRYGTTLRGLMTEHGVDPEPFLDHIHRVDFELVQPNPELALKLGRLPGRKLIFTNSSRLHAHRVMERLGITEHIEEVFDISDADYIPKPDRECYAMLLERHGVGASNACMIDDIAVNLEPAKALGMTTVWLKGEGEWARPDPDPAILRQIDFVAENLVHWLNGVIGYLERPPAARPV